MNMDFSQERIRLIWELTEKADNFTKVRLIKLARRYDDPKHRPFSEVPHNLANLSAASNR